MNRTRLVVLSLLAALLLVAPAAHGTSPGLVLSQVYPGGGNSGQGLYYSTDYGASWHAAVVKDGVGCTPGTFPAI